MSDALSDPLMELRGALRRLHRRAGEPSSRTIGRAVGYAHTTVAGLFTATRCPTWDLLSRVVAHLDGDTEEFRRLWIAVRDGDDPLPGATTTEPDPERTPLIRMDRRDGARSEVLWIYDPTLAREALRSYFRHGDDHGDEGPEERDD